jgi:hypothetical protein
MATTPRRKVIRRLLFSLIVAVLFAVFDPILIDSRSLAHAIHEWRSNPTPATEAAVKLLQKEVHEEVLRIRIWTGIVLFAVTASAWFAIEGAVDRYRNRSQA